MLLVALWLIANMLTVYLLSNYFSHHVKLRMHFQVSVSQEELLETCGEGACENSMNFLRLATVVIIMSVIGVERECVTEIVYWTVIKSCLLVRIKPKTVSSLQAKFFATH